MALTNMGVSAPGVAWISQMLGSKLLEPNLRLRQLVSIGHAEEI